MSEKEDRWDVPTDMTFEFMQEADTNSEAPGSLTVRVFTEGYVVLQTERWALGPEEIDRFAAMLRRCLRGETGWRDYFGEGDDNDRSVPPPLANSATGDA